MKTLKLHYAMMQFLKAFTRAERVSTRQHVGYNIIKILTWLPSSQDSSLYLQTTFLVQSCCKSIKDHILVVTFKLSRLVGFLAFCSSSVCVRFFLIKCYLFQWNMESCPLLWNDTSEEESVNGNHWNRWGEMFVILKHKLLQRLVHNHVGRKNDCKSDTKQRSLSVV